MILAAVVLGLAYANGANDNIKGAATRFGTGTSGIGLAWVVTLPLSALLAAAGMGILR